MSCKTYIKYIRILFLVNLSFDTEVSAENLDRQKKKIFPPLQFRYKYLSRNSLGYGWSWKTHFLPNKKPIIKCKVDCWFKICIYNGFRN